MRRLAPRGCRIAPSSSARARSSRARAAAVRGRSPRRRELENREYVQHKELVAQFGGEYRAPAAEHFLDDILVKLAQASDTPGQAAYKVTILNTPVVNAFALPSGNLYVTRGLLALAGDASEAAAVMAHEIAHVTLRHSALRAEREREAAVISQAAAVIQNKQKGEEVRSSQRLSVASFSRQQELDADATGVRVIARAGFDPYGASRFLTALGKSSELRAALYGKQGVAWASTSCRRIPRRPSASPRPSPPRARSARRASARATATAISRRSTASPSATIRMEGYVRGRKFTHPRLRFTFTAPEGFLLENSSEAVFGVRRAGQRGAAARQRAQPQVGKSRSLCRLRLGRRPAARRR